MDRHVKWLRRRISASVATQTALTFAVVAALVFAILQWRTDEGLITALFASVVVAQLIALARVGHAMRNNPLNYVFMRRYIDIPFTYRVTRYSSEEDAHPIAQRLPGFEPIATIRDSAADPEPVFDIYHDPSRLVVASISRASGSISLISSLKNDRMLVTDTRLMPPHERLVMSLAASNSVESVIDTHRRAISARSDVVALAPSAHQVVLESLAIEHESYGAIGPFLSPFLDLEPQTRSRARLTAKIKPHELVRLPTRLGPDFAMSAHRPAAASPTNEQPTRGNQQTPQAPATPVAAAPELNVPQVIAPEIAKPSMVLAEIVTPDLANGSVPVSVSDVVAPVVGDGSVPVSVSDVVAPVVGDGSVPVSVSDVVAPVVGDGSLPVSVSDVVAPVVGDGSVPVSVSDVVAPVVGDGSVPVSVSDVVAPPVENEHNAQPPVEPPQTPLDLAAAIASLGAVPAIDEVVSAPVDAVPSAAEVVSAPVDAVPPVADVVSAPVDAVPPVAEVVSAPVGAVPAIDGVVSAPVDAVPPVADVVPAATGAAQPADVAEPVVVESQPAEPRHVAPLAQRPLSVPVRVPSPVASYLLAPPHVVAASLSAYVANERGHRAPTSPHGSNSPAPEPSLAEPGATAPGAAAAPEPSLAEPVATAPGAPEPSLAEPRATAPGAPEPSLAEPVATAPGAPEPSLAEPVATTPGAPAPVVPSSGSISPAPVVPSAGSISPAPVVPSAGSISPAPVTSLGDAVVSAPDTPVSLDAPIATEWPPRITRDADDEPMLVPNLSAALGRSEALSANRPRLSAVIRANAESKSVSAPAPARRSRRKTR